MENLATQIWIGIIGVIASFIVGLFKKELGTMWTAWRVYKSRPFDSDRDPNTPDRCEIFGENAQGGKDFEEVEIIKYCFWTWNRDKRGVYINHLLPDGKKAPRKISLCDWGNLIKRGVPK